MGLHIFSNQEFFIADCLGFGNDPRTPHSVIALPPTLLVPMSERQMLVQMHHMLVQMNRVLLQLHQTQQSILEQLRVLNSHFE
eukprot:m51a1_g13781 hypothetical protein (83) ;mRNA; f:305327-306260